MAGIDYGIVIVYLTAMVLVGVWLQKKASEGIDSYFLGNRSIPWWALAASGMSSNLDVTGTMINTALLFALGVSGFFVEIRGGVTLILAFLMIFMGKWNRRAQVMTLAEWMKLRFGEKKDGDAARIICAVGSIVMTIAMVVYFCKGAGKFVAIFLNLPPFMGLPADFWAALIMIILAMIYTVASGLYGVVWTDVFQGVIIFATIAMVCFLCVTKHKIPEKIKLSAVVKEEKLAKWNKKYPEKKIGPGTEQDGYKFQEVKDRFTGKKKLIMVWEKDSKEWTALVPPAKLDFHYVSDYSMFNLLGLLIFFYLIKVTMEGAGGAGGYMCQRYFAAKSDREAGLLSLCWTFLLSFRWPFIAAIAIIGVSSNFIGDPETLLPQVIMGMPIGLKGLLVAGLMAAAMSTFDSTVNAGAAYWVKDIYQAYIKKDADEKQLVWQSRFSSVGIVLIALICSLAIKNINEIWGWITMGISAGMFVPQIVRWYWWRLNGWGFAIGTAAGMIAAILQKYFLPAGTAEYVTFSIVICSSIIATIIGTLLTSPTDEKILGDFYRKTRPFGIWAHVRERLPQGAQDAINAENKRDLISTCVAVPWQLSLFLTWIMAILQRWSLFGVCLGILIVTSIILYFKWYRHLSEEVDIDSFEGNQA